MLLLSCSVRAVLGSETAGWPGAGEVTYVSKGLNSGHNWGTFVLHPGDRGRAIYTDGEESRSGKCECSLSRFFRARPIRNVLFAVYRETAPNPARQDPAMGVSDRLPDAQWVRDLRQG